MIVYRDGTLKIAMYIFCKYWRYLYIAKLYAYVHKKILILKDIIKSSCISIVHALFHRI